MSFDPTMALAPEAFRRRERWAARVAVAAARVLARRPPKSIAAILTTLSRRARPAGFEQASRARAVVTGTSLACASPQGCLARSIATALLCRMGGTWPTWCAGVRTLPPFGAHAWVTAEGREVGEPTPPGYHRVLLQVPPAREKDGPT
ncbi:lasso peptide biosynthesis B2 protein [Nonomuraea sp. NPDC050790]|uniref:lasso peptide biosynthesis B2 protein n=1 Tax=Nonomuraea sp. NPDC050790 TaxID=3364371 RepID=UPI0037A2494A